VPQWRETQAAAAQAAIALVPFELRSPDQLEEAFARFARERADALLIPPDVTFTTHRRRIVNLALDARLPTIFFLRQSAEDGGLMSYGTSQPENFRRAATYVDTRTAMRKSNSRTSRKPGNDVSAIRARHSRVKPSTIASPLPPVGSTDDPTRDLGSRDRIAEVLSAAGARPPVRVRRAGMLTEQPALVCARPSTVGRHERGRQ
jgi:hypothetical protein